MKNIIDKINANETVKYIIIFEFILFICIAAVGLSWKLSRDMLEVKKPSKYVEQDKIFMDTTKPVDLSDLSPGVTRSGEFVIENKSKYTQYYNLYWENVENNFTRNSDLKYSISSTNGGAVLELATVPETGKDILIQKQVEIKSGEKQTYTITYTYINSPTENQDIDKGKTFDGTINFKCTFEKEK